MIPDDTSIGPLILFVWLLAASAWLYGLTRGYGTFGRLIRGRVLLGVLGGLVLNSLLGGVLAAVMPGDGKQGTWDRILSGMIVYFFLAGIPAAVLGALYSLVASGIRLNREARVASDQDGRPDDSHSRA